MHSDEYLAGFKDGIFHALSALAKQPVNPLTESSEKKHEDVERSDSQFDDDDDDDGDDFVKETRLEKSLKLRQALYKRELKRQRANHPEAIERRYWAQVDADNQSARIERIRTGQVRPEFDKDVMRQIPYDQLYPDKDVRKSMAADRAEYEELLRRKSR